MTWVLKIMNMLIRQISTTNQLLLLKLLRSFSNFFFSFSCINHKHTDLVIHSQLTPGAALQLISRDLHKLIRPWRSPHLHPASHGSIWPTSSMNQARSKREQHRGDQRLRLSLNRQQISRGLSRPRLPSQPRRRGMRRSRWRRSGGGGKGGGSFRRVQRRRERWGSRRGGAGICRQPTTCPPTPLARLDGWTALLFYWTGTV